MSAFFNLGSLFLGIASWVIPLVALKQHKNNRSIIGYSICSFTACALALMFQLLEIKSRVILGDWTALMDTIGAVTAVAGILVVITLALNLMANAVCAAKIK